MTSLEINNKYFKNIFCYMITILLIFILILPPLWMIMTAFKSGRDVFSIPPKFFFTPQLDNFIKIINSFGILEIVKNTLIVCIVSTILTQVAGSMAAYSIARFRTGGKALMYGTLVMRVIPPVVLALPLFILFRNLGLVDTLHGLIIAYLAFLLPNTIWLLLAFFSDIPKTIEEAARIDGCSQMGVFFRVVLPLARSGIIVTSVYNITGSWNHFFYALILAPTKTRMLSVEASRYVGDYVVQWGEVAAIGTLLILPPAIFILTIQKYLVSGLALGGVKG